MVPFGVASTILVFGQFVTAWLALHIIPSARTPVYIVALLLRWVSHSRAVSASSASSITWGRPCEQSWKRVLPGAVLATALWFLTTLAFGWYVTRFANYSQVYGSLGAGIALLFWLYLISLCVLYGAEFNTEFHARYFHSHRNSFRPVAPKRPPAS